MPFRSIAWRTLDREDVPIVKDKFLSGERERSEERAGKVRLMNAITVHGVADVCGSGCSESGA